MLGTCTSLRSKKGCYVYSRAHEAETTRAMSGVEERSFWALGKRISVNKWGAGFASQERPERGWNGRSR
jgi:hypothetical protein